MELEKGGIRREEDKRCIPNAHPLVKVKQQMAHNSWVRHPQPPAHPPTPTHTHKHTSGVGQKGIGTDYGSLKMTALSGRLLLSSAEKGSPTSRDERLASSGNGLANKQRVCAAPTNCGPLTCIATPRHQRLP